MSICMYIHTYICKTVEIPLLPSPKFPDGVRQDGTLEGRYATALFMASKDKLDKAQPGKP